MRSEALEREGRERKPGFSFPDKQTKKGNEMKISLENIRNMAEGILDEVAEAEAKAQTMVDVIGHKKTDELSADSTFKIVGVKVLNQDDIRVLIKETPLIKAE